MKRIALIVVASLLAAAGARAAAAEWPSKTVRIVVPFAPASSPDLVARILAEKLQQKLGKPFVVENKPGASGNIGTDTVTKSPADGHTIGVSIGGPLALNTLLYERMPYDPFKDLAPVTLLISQPSVVVVANKLNIGSFAELKDQLKANPDKFNFGSIGYGSISHLVMELIAKETGARMVHVPYPGSSQANVAVMVGEVDMACLPPIAVMPHARAGKEVAVAVTTAERSPLLPELPSLKEASGIDIDADSWMGLIAPARTSDTVLSALHGAIADVLGADDVKAKLHAQFMTPALTTPAQFAAYLRRYLARWEPIIREKKIRLD
jgi:tripartite-type tricarboxylate transporter receptor subunit TctC